MIRTTSELDLSAATSSHRFQQHFSTCVYARRRWGWFVLGARVSIHIVAAAAAAAAALAVSTAIIFHLGPFPSTPSQLCILADQASDLEWWTRCVATATGVASRRAAVPWCGARPLWRRGVHSLHIPTVRCVFWQINRVLGTHSSRKCSSKREHANNIEL